MVQYLLFPMNCDHPGCEKNSTVADDFVNDTVHGGNYCKLHISYCHGCDIWHYKGEFIKIPRGTHPYTDQFCKTCYENEFEQCPNCSELVSKDDIVPPDEQQDRYGPEGWVKLGGCSKCVEVCYSCSKVIDNDFIYKEIDSEFYCTSCHSEYFTICDRCGETVDRESAIWVETSEQELCNSCYDEQYTTCNDCGDKIEKSESFELDDEYYCEKCYDKQVHNIYNEETERFTQFSYNKKERYLNVLEKLVPISVKELKSKHQSIAAGLQDLIIFAKGKDITQDIIIEYKNTLSYENFPVEYTLWSGLQRSVESETPQLVLNIVASDKILNEIKSDPIIFDLFNKINKLSAKSGHPYVDEQIGWARLELDPNGVYILIDEIQTDHSNATYRIKNSKNEDAIRVREGLKNHYNLSDEDLIKTLDKYAAFFKDFPNIATKAILDFAKANNFKELYWHTYESGKDLKSNAPPKSLYEKVPKENFFLPTNDTPFNLQGQFLKRLANQRLRVMQLLNLN